MLRAPSLGAMRAAANLPRGARGRRFAPRRGRPLGRGRERLCLAHLVEQAREAATRAGSRRDPDAKPGRACQRERQIHAVAAAHEHRAERSREGDEGDRSDEQPEMECELKDDAPRGTARARVERMMQHVGEDAHREVARATPQIKEPSLETGRTRRIRPVGVKRERIKQRGD